MQIELTEEQVQFLQQIMCVVLPNMQVAAKEASAILEQCQAILTKLQGE